VAELLYNTEAVVIRSIAYGETHAIITLLTPSGRVAAMARGSKRPQSRLAAGIQLCVQGTYVIYQNRGMGNVQQFDLLDARRPLREKLELAAYAAYFCELAGAAAEEYPNGSAGLYHQFVSALDRLIGIENQPVEACRIWEAKVLRALGASPDWEHCVRCGSDCSTSVLYAPSDGGFLCESCSAKLDDRARLMRVTVGIPRLLNQMSDIPFARIGNIRLGEHTRRSLNRVLHMQLSDFAGVSVKSRSVLESLVLDNDS
jgi:DNA repair protein RecO (recombination protein O)